MRTIIRRDPFDTPPFTALDRLMNSFLNGPAMAGFPMVAPVDEGNLPIDISEDERSVIVRASVPGFDKSQIEVELHEGVLTIKAERNEQTEDKGETFYRRERRYGAVTRRVALPTVSLEGEPAAELKDGVLTLRIPKSEKAMPKKVRIE